MCDKIDSEWDFNQVFADKISKCTKVLIIKKYVIIGVFDAYVYYAN